MDRFAILKNKQTLPAPKDAIERAHELMGAPIELLPILLQKYTEHFLATPGVPLCAPTFLMANAQYAQAVEGCVTDDPKYKLTNEAKEWFAQWDQKQHSDRISDLAHRIQDRFKELGEEIKSDGSRTLQEILLMFLSDIRQSSGESEKAVSYLYSEVINIFYGQEMQSRIEAELASRSRKWKDKLDRIPTENSSEEK